MVNDAMSYITQTQKMVKIGRVYMIADRQTHRQTDTLIAILGTAHRGRSNKSGRRSGGSKVKTGNRQTDGHD